MGTRPGPALWTALAAVAVLLGQSVAGRQQVSPCDRPGPLTLKSVEESLDNGVSPKRILGWVNSCGVTFILDNAGAERLRKRGSPGSLDLLIKALVAPAPAAGQQWKAPVDGKEMTGIDPGTFLMGSPDAEPGRDGDEQQHAVEIGRAFWLDTMDVTNEAFSRFLAQNPAWQKGSVDSKLADSNYLYDWLGGQYPEGAAARPVVYVSWYAAAAYADWAGKRLPTEAEWEYACRAGTTAAYWWGSTFDATRANNSGQLQPVGGAAHRNPWGLYDMLGNVWQWTSTAYRPYPYRADAREDPKVGGARTVRGGYWNAAGGFLRSANRNSLPPSVTSDQVGFRCAR